MASMVSNREMVNKLFYYLACPAQSTTCIPFSGSPEYGQNICFY